MLHKQFDGTIDGVALYALRRGFLPAVARRLGRALRWTRLEALGYRHTYAGAILNLMDKYGGTGWHLQGWAHRPAPAPEARDA